jgi:hypothetical protein
MNFCEVCNQIVNYDEHCNQPTTPILFDFGGEENNE